MKTIQKQWFLLALAAALALGFSFADWVSAVGHTPGLRSGLVASVLFLMGLTVPAGSFGSALRSPKAGLLALVLNIVAVPLIAATLANLLPASLAGGLVVAAAVPCTLASALAWTRRGHGNEVVPMMVMLVTNSLCFLIAPATLLLLLGQTVQLNFADQASKLALLVVLPLAIAALVRLRRGIAQWADANKQSLTTIALCGILVMVSFGAAATSLQSFSSAEQGGPPENTATFWITVAGLLALLTHLTVLAGGWWLAGRMGLSHPDRVAVAIAGSQKTLMVGLQISLDCGVSTLPMTLYHVGQLLSDTVFVSRVAHAPPETAPQS